MPTYYVQKFTYDSGDSKCYGAMPAHDHGAAAQFTTDVTTYLTNQGCKHIVPGPFLSNQPAPAAGKEFRWVDASRTWVKA